MKFSKQEPAKSGWYWTYDSSFPIGCCGPTPVYFSQRLQVICRNGHKFALSAYTDQFLLWGDELILPEVELDDCES